MTLLIKTAFPVYISAVKFASPFKESPCSPVVTFPSFGSEGHGVQPPQGDSFFRVSFGLYLSFTYNPGFLYGKDLKMDFKANLRLKQDLSHF